MAFGASLIGVAIDYSIHVIDHQRLTPEVPASTIVRRLRPSLLLGASTTMASFAGLMLTSFPGFREIGVFSIVGVGASLVATLAVLPGLLGNGSRARPVPELARRTARALGSAVVFLAPHRRWLACVPIVCLGAMTVFVPRIGFVDDLSRLMAMDPDLRAEEDRVRARVARMSESRVVVALADDTAAAVALNDRVAERLAAARDAGVLEEFRSLHALLWSEALQDRNLAALDAVPDLADRVETAFVAEGFRAAALAGFREALDSPAPPPLRAEDLVNSPLGDLVSPLLLPLGDRVAVVTYLSDVSSAGALTHALEGLEHVHVFDQRSFLNAIYREFRITTLEQMALGSALVILVLGLRYRRWRPALAALLPSLFVAGSLLALFGAFGVEINLLHVTSLILVMGMGVDYGIFVVDTAVDRPSLDATTALAPALVPDHRLRVRNPGALGASGAARHRPDHRSRHPALLRAGARHAPPGASGGPGSTRREPCTRAGTQPATALGRLRRPLRTVAPSAPGRLPGRGGLSGDASAGDFVLREQLRLVGDGVDAGFGLVAERRGDRLVLVGFNAFGAKAFAVIQRGTDARGSLVPGTRAADRARQRAARPACRRTPGTRRASARGSGARPLRLHGLLRGGEPRAAQRRIFPVTVLAIRLHHPELARDLVGRAARARQWATSSARSGRTSRIRRHDLRDRDLAQVRVLAREDPALAHAGMQASSTASTSSAKNFIPAMLMRLARRPARWRSPSASNQP